MRDRQALTTAFRDRCEEIRACALAAAQRDPRAPTIDLEAVDLEHPPSTAVDLIDGDAALDRPREIHPRRADVADERLFSELGTPR